jgi:TRAP-type uncharacterized transport system substrate-binding protein
MQRKNLLRLVSLVVASAVLAALALSYSTVRDYGRFRAAILTGSPGGAYHSLASDLAKLTRRDGGRLEVLSTAGSIENARRLVGSQARCVEKFGFVQDGTPVSSDSGVELLGRLPEPESLLILARRDRSFGSFSDLRGVSIGVGPEDSGTAFLALQLLGDPDLQKLAIRSSFHELEEQARLVASGELDIAAYVMKSDAEFLRTIIGRYDLEVVELRDLRGLTDRYPWLSLGRVPAGRFDLMRQVPATDKLVPQVNTLVLASPCAKRADRIELLVLLTAALPTFVRSNPPNSTSPATALPLAAEARQFFVAGEPEFVDRYFPWLVNFMSPAYWIYLAMAATALFNLLKGVSRFRLWRLDTTREKLEGEAKAIVNSALAEAGGHGRSLSLDMNTRSDVADLLDKFTKLRDRCRKYVNSFVTPMGDEMFYRYQQSLIDRAMADLKEAIAPETAATATS